MVDFDKQITNDKEYLATFAHRQRIRATHNFARTSWTMEYSYKLVEPKLTKLLEEYENLKGDKYRVGTWIPTISGNRLWINDPRVEEINLFDMAFGLARIARFNSMTIGKPYSVAQHSLLGSFFIEDELKLFFLTHDGQEYAMQDIVTPLKYVLGDVYKQAEQKMQNIIAQKIGIEWTPKAKKRCKEIDNMMLASEVEQFTPYKVIPGELPALGIGQKITILSWQDAFKNYSEAINKQLGYKAINSIEETLGSEALE